MNLRELGELGLLKRLKPYLSGSGHELLIGAGEDDAAAWREPDGSITIATCDSFVEGVHFDLARLRAEDVGWRCLALAVSDLAAKGAEPSYGMVTLSAPPDWAVATAEELYRGLAAAAEMCRLKLVGGDTTSTSGPATITVFALGRARTEPIARSRARPGWELAVTGALGAAKAGQEASSRGDSLDPAWVESLRRPRPRLREGARLCAAGLVCGDISDGLLRELDKLSAVAGVGAILNRDAVPVAANCSWEQAVSSGEEMELFCAGPAAAIAAGAELLTVVGELTGDGRVVLVDSNGAEITVLARGYEHFA